MKTSFSNPLLRESRSGNPGTIQKMRIRFWICTFFLLISSVSSDILHAQVHSRRDITNDFNAAERCQLRNLMITFLSSPAGIAVINSHAAPATFQMIHCYNEVFLSWHREHIRHHIEEWLLTQDGGSKYVPLPEWNPATPIPCEFFNSSCGTCPGNAVVLPTGTYPLLTNQNPSGFNFTPYLNAATLCSYTSGNRTPPQFSKPSRFGTAADNMAWALQQQHNTVHVSTGGVMLLGTSPAAAIFYLWHGYVDDIYRKYQCNCQADTPRDLYIADSNEDIGEEANTHSSLFYLSPEIWVRNNQDVFGTDGRYTKEDIVLRHENPEAGQINYIYVRIRNIGCVQTTAGQVNLRVYYSKASTGLTWPTNWVNYVVSSTTYGNEITVSPVSVPTLDPGESYVAEVQWSPPDPAIFGETQSHICLLARLESTVDPMAFVETTDVNANTRNNNNVAWKNTQVVNINPFAPPPAPGLAEFVFQVTQPLTLTDPIKLTFTKAENFHLDEVIVRANPAVMDTFLLQGQLLGLEVLSDSQGLYFSIREQTASIGNLFLPPGATVPLKLTFKMQCAEQGGVPCARFGDVYRYDVQQFTQGVFGDGFVGGIGYELRIQQSPETVCDPLIGSVAVKMPDCQNTPSGRISLNLLGQPPYTIYWSNGANAGDNFGLLPGRYAVTVVDAANCIDTMSFQLSDLSDLKVEFAVNHAFCDVPNGSIQANVSGGTPPYSTQWSTGSQELSINNLEVGTYTFTVTDATGCQRTDSVALGQVFPLGGLTLSTDASSAAANDGSARIIPTSGIPPYQFNWSNGATTDSIANLSPGGYVVTLTDALGCKFVDTVTVSFTNAIEELNFDNASVELLPNPVSSKMEVEIKNWSPASLQISITDVTGQVIRSGNYPVQFGRVRIDVADLPDGFYYLTLSDGRNSISKKFTKI